MAASTRWEPFSDAELAALWRALETDDVECSVYEYEPASLAIAQDLWDERVRRGWQPLPGEERPSGR